MNHQTRKQNARELSELFKIFMGLMLLMLAIGHMGTAYGAMDTGNYTETMIIGVIALFDLILWMFMWKGYNSARWLMAFSYSIQIVCMMYSPSGALGEGEEGFIMAAVAMIILAINPMFNYYFKVRALHRNCLRQYKEYFETRYSRPVIIEQKFSNTTFEMEKMKIAVRVQDEEEVECCIYTENGLIKDDYFLQYWNRRITNEVQSKLWQWAFDQQVSDIQKNAIKKLSIELTNDNLQEIYYSYKTAREAYDVFKQEPIPGELHPHLICWIGGMEYDEEDDNVEEMVAFIYAILDRLVQCHYPIEKLSVNLFNLFIVADWILGEENESILKDLYYKDVCKIVELEDYAWIEEQVQAHRKHYFMEDEEDQHCGGTLI